MKILMMLVLGVIGADDVVIDIENCEPEYVMEEAAEMVDLFEDPEIVDVNSLEGVIEKETAQVLQIQDEDALPRVAEPQVEDLSLLVQRPHVTLAQPPSEEVELNAYESLPITLEEKQKISELLNTMAENNVFMLLFEKKHLERLGQDINHVHPMRFIGTVFSSPRLKYCMHQIRRSGFKWDGFMDGFSERFAQEQKANNINAYVPGLAEVLGVNEADMQKFINKKDFVGLINFLMVNARPQRQ
ncbi:MAG: hypothetical protein P0S96_08350 [Simkaniaceae bacterium]|nr:hypothetical protein [Candidatus Sacchlamyda saccharinae]